jgi:ligand-binding sensor domain-containing protein
MRFSIFFIFLLFQLPIKAQEYTYTRYDIRDGLAGSTVYCSVQDKNYFMWFGTETGLSRFDGTNFTNFTTKDGLPDNEVLKLFCDSKDRIWCSLFKQNICYILNGKIHNQNNDSTLKKISLKGIAWQVCEDKKGNILIREDHVLHLVTPGGDVRNIYSINNTISPIFCSASQSSNGNFLICESNKIYELDSEGQTKLLKILPVNKNLMGNIKLNKDLIFWPPSIFTFNIFFFQKKSDLTFTGPPSIINVQFLSDSLISFNKVEGCVIINFYTNKRIENILPDEAISSVAFDYENGLWFTTLGHGIFRLSSSDFKTYNFKRENNNALPVFSIVSYKNYIYAGADGSYLFKINRNFSNYDRYKIHFSKEVKNRIVSIETEKGTFFLGTDVALFKVSDLKNDKIFQYFTVKKLLLLNNDSLFIAGKSGLLLLNPNTLKVLDTLLSERVVSFNVVGSNLFVATLNELYTIDLKNNKRTSLKLPIPNIRIAVLEKDLNDILWIGTNGSGLLAYKNGKFIYALSEKEGLTSNVCRCISIYKNILWIGTDKGVNKVDLYPSPHLLNKFTNTDGLPSNVINAILQDSDYVYIGSEKGLTFFNNQTIRSVSKCVLKITNIICNTDTVADKTVFLPPRKRDIKFEYAGISYSSVGDIKYFYRLKGLQDIWETTVNTSVSYPSLPSGRYFFEIKAVNKYGIQSNTIIVPVVVKEKFFEKIWVRVLILLLIGIAIWLIMKNQINKIKYKEIEKNNTRKQITELRQKALKSQISPHFIFNCLNSIQQYILENDIEGSNSFISRFSELVRRTLDLSEKSEISIREEFEYLNKYLLLEQERFEDKFQFKISVSSQDEAENNFIPPLILQPLVENSIKHGVRARNDDEGFIEIKAEISPDYVFLMVIDNGPGIYHMQNFKSNIFSDHISIGMSLVQERIKALNDLNGKKATIVIEEMDEKNYYHGTIIKIKIPVI